jgi:RNA 2',3'-cyclic 3'-phosphodiesterase
VSTIAIAHRLFVALDLPDDARLSFANLSRRLADEYGGRAVPAENLHITLSFVGAIAGETVATALDGVRDALVGPAITTYPTRVVGRPRPGAARVLAVELDDTSGEMSRIAQRVVDATAAVSSVSPPRGFWPHITLVRLSHPTRVRRFPIIGIEHVFDISRASFYDSRIAPGQSPRYEALYSTALGTPA